MVIEHYHGKDLLKENGPVLNSRMYLVDEDNVATVRSRMNAEYFNTLDFRSFSTQSEGAPLSLPQLVLSALSGNADSVRIERDSPEGTIINIRKK